MLKIAAKCVSIFLNYIARAFWCLIGILCILILACVLSSQFIDKAPLGLYKIEMIKDLKVVVSRYESKKMLHNDTSLTSKTLIDSEYKFILNEWMFDVKEGYMTGGFILVDSYNFNLEDRNIHYYPPDDFEEARRWWEYFRHYKGLP